MPYYRYFRKVTIHSDLVFCKDKMPNTNDIENVLFLGLLIFRKPYNIAQLAFDFWSLKLESNGSYGVYKEILSPIWQPMCTSNKQDPGV